MNQAPNHPTITTKGVLRPTYLEIDLSRLTNNYRAIQTLVGGVKVMPILKANAYGHGMVEVAKHMVAIGADRIGVALLEEGLLLREAGIKLPILILGGILGKQIPLFLQNDLSLTASSQEKLQAIDEAAAQMGVTPKVHLKIDTGMERIGVHYYSAKPLLEAALKCQHLEVEGIFSHLANSDVPDLASVKLQVQRFQETLKFYDDRSLPTPIRHIANSGAILQFPDSFLDMVRPGILLYGVYPSSEVSQSIAVQPALSWKSQVVYFKVVEANHPVSYGSTWQSDHQVRVVTVPIGYGDGYFRSMSGKAQALLGGKRYPVVGRVTMDQLMLNIEWDSAYNGDEVVLVGQMGSQKITVEDLAEWAGTIPYEILTNINTRVPRVYLPDNTD